MGPESMAENKWVSLGSFHHFSSWSGVDPTKITAFPGPHFAVRYLFDWEQPKKKLGRKWMGWGNVLYDPFGGFLFGDFEIYPIQECQPSALFHLRFLLESTSTLKEKNLIEKT